MPARRRRRRSRRHIQRLRRLALLLGVAVCAGAGVLAFRGMGGAAGGPGPGSAVAASLPAVTATRTQPPPSSVPDDTATPTAVSAISAAPLERTGSGVLVPVLMYHYIRWNPSVRDRAGYDLSVTPEDFAQQLDVLQRNGFVGIDLGRLADAVEGRAALPPRAVVLTFDDGYEDFYTDAVPTLRAHGFTATDFVVSGLVGTANHMDAAQLRAVVGMGFTIGAHTVDHIDLTSVPLTYAAWEMASSRLTLRQITGQPVTDFAYPSGRFDHALERVAATCGFRTAVTTAAGDVHTSTHLRSMTRVRVFGGMNLAGFAAMLRLPASAAEGYPPTHRRPPPPPTPTPDAASTDTAAPLGLPRLRVIARVGG